MSRQIQIRRGTAAEHENFTGAVGEITMDTTNNTLRVHDGQTPGGTPLAKQSEIPQQQTLPDNYDFVVESQLPTAENNYTWYRKYKSGWVEQGGWVSGGQHVETSVVFPVVMSNIYYSLCIGGTVNPNARSTGTPSYRAVFAAIGTVTSKTTTGFVLGNGEQISWQVSGVAAA